MTRVKSVAYVGIMTLVFLATAEPANADGTSPPIPACNPVSADLICIQEYGQEILRWANATVDDICAGFRTPVVLDHEPQMRSAQIGAVMYYYGADPIYHHDYGVFELQGIDDTGAYEFLMTGATLSYGCIEPT